MPTKPTSADFTFSTDLNFSSGPAAGNPTKVAPAGWPSNLQGFVPGLEYAAEFRNYLLNKLGSWTGWLEGGSSAGAADAHIVETDSNGDTALRDLTLLATTFPQLAFNPDNPTDAELLLLKISGTGANPGGNFVRYGQQGQDQTGGANNNDGGDIVDVAGQRGSGGSGTGGKGFGGAAREGGFLKYWPSSPTEMRIRTGAERFTLASAASPVAVLGVDAPSDKANNCLIVALISIENGGGTGLKHAIQIIAYNLKREGTTITASGSATIASSSTFTTSPPGISVGNVGDGSFTIDVSGAPSESSANVLYACMMHGKVSA